MWFDGLPKVDWVSPGKEIVIFQGDALATLRTFPAESVQCVVTSPPYWKQRNYQCAGQLGREKMPADYVAVLVPVFRECRRVLKDDGVLWIVCGDSYFYRSASGGDRRKAGSLLKERDLIGLPWMLAFALRDDGWWLRQDCVWQKPDPMPDGTKDRCTKAHEYIFLLSKSANYYFDVDAIAEPKECWLKRGAGRNKENPDRNDKGIARFANKDFERGVRNKRSVWTVSTSKLRESHFAVFPEKLIEPCVLAGSRPGDVVLDPFSGAGTTGLVSAKYGRNAALIELNPEYVKMAAKRLTAGLAQAVATGSNSANGLYLRNCMNNEFRVTISDLVGSSSTAGVVLDGVGGNPSSYNKFYLDFMLISDTSGTANGVAAASGCNYNTFFGSVRLYKSNKYSDSGTGNVWTLLAG